MRKLLVILLLCGSCFAQGFKGQVGFGGKTGFTGMISTTIPIALDSNGVQKSAALQTGANPILSVTIAVGCVHPVLYVLWNLVDAGTPATGTASYNSASMLSVANIGASSKRTQIFRLIGPTHDGAAHNVQITTISPSVGAGITAVPLCNVSQTTPEDVTGVTSSGTSASATCTLTTVTTDAWYVQAATAEATTFGVGDSATQDLNLTNGSSYAFITAHKGPLGTGGAKTPTDSLGSAAWNMACVAVRPG